MNLRILLILGALSAFGPLAIDFYLPSFPTLAKAFATDVEHVQLSLAAYFAGLSIGQLLYGPVADRYGRRLPLLVGVSIFTLASAACALAPSLEWLIAARFVQALGGCAGMVISRAVVCGLALLGIASLQPATLWPLLVPLFGCVASLGCIIPNASACAMAGQGQHAGSASALMGSLQFSVAAGASALVGVLHDGTAIPMTLVIAVCGAVATLLAWQTGRLERQAA
ncbi:MFS transporter [Pseudomonas aeruginosa]